MSDHLRPHCDTSVCGKCRKKIEAGHRVTQALIAVGPGRNPHDVLQVGMLLSEEWELVHVDCHNPLLTKGLTE